MSKHVVLVHGSWGRAHPWHLAGATIPTRLRERGFIVHDFLWSGFLAGVPTKLPGDPLLAKCGADDGRLLPWYSEGEKLWLFLRSRGLTEDQGMVPHVLSHSHAIQIVTFSTWAGASYDVAISVSGPIRTDMQRARRYAATRIRRWIQFADPDLDPNAIEDTTIDAGEWFDGSLRSSVDLPEGETIHTEDTGHSLLLDDPALLTKYAVLSFFPANGR